MKVSLLRTLTAAAAALAVTAGSASADYQITFTQNNSGKIVSEVYDVDDNIGPIGVYGTNPNFPGENAAMIFDSDCDNGCSGQDDDLGTPNMDFGGPGIGVDGQNGMEYQNDRRLKEVLIVTEDFDTADPDDADVEGAQLTLDFSAIGPVTLTKMKVLDIEADEPNATATLLGAGDAPLAVIEIPAVGDNGMAIVGLGPTRGVLKLVVDLNGSGAIDDITFNQRTECGDDIRDTGEECDGIDDASCPGACLSDCTCDVPDSVCGDGVRDPGEECDGNDCICEFGCQDDCTCAPNPTPICGNHVLDAGEECERNDGVISCGWGERCTRDCTCEPKKEHKGCRKGDSDSHKHDKGDSDSKKWGKGDSDSHDHKMKPKKGKKKRKYGKKKGRRWMTRNAG